MERQDSIVSHSPSRAECPQQPSATILAVGEVTETTQSLGFLLLSHRLDNQLSHLQRTVT